MLDSEYRKRREATENKRDWIVTALLGAFALLVWSGVVAAWRYVGHDATIIFTIILPLGGLALILSFGAIQGSRQAAKETMKAIAALFVYWG